ncbi:uronyl 2-sulfotransferase homolog pip-like [Glossina fuscipes fuscipes]
MIGASIRCTILRAFNLLAAAQIAKGHVERGYAVVGSWEDTNITLGVFENYIPRFFCAAKVIYEMHEEHISNRNRNKRKPQIDDDVKATIRRNFTYEYEFYYFCNQSIYKQYLAINLIKLQAKKNTFI